jgi:hypothetical protein
MKPTYTKTCRNYLFFRVIKEQKGNNKNWVYKKGINILCFAESECPLFLLVLTANVAKPPQFLLLKCNYETSITEGDKYISSFYEDTVNICLAHEWARRKNGDKLWSHCGIHS